MASEVTDAVLDFCAGLRRLVQGCGVQRSVLARELRRGEAAVDELLDGRRGTLPPLDDVLRIIAHCRAQTDCRARTGDFPPPGPPLDPAWWRTRHAVAESAAVTQRRHRVRTDFPGAVEVLIGGRGGFEGVAYELLEPLELSGGTAADLRGLLDGFAARVRASRGTTRTALLCAADVVVLVTAFCEAVAGAGIVPDSELGAGQGDIITEVLEELGRITLGSVRVRDAAELRAEVVAAYEAAAEIVHGLGDPHGHRPRDLVEHAMRRYEALLADVTSDCPELRLTSGAYGTDGQPPEAAECSGLRRFGLLLGEFADRGPVRPMAAAGYVNPGFRVAGHPVGRELSSDAWWERQPLRADIDEFLAAHLLTDQATRSPLLVYGHPGSGKSLLAGLIEARLPEGEFFCLRVDLRRVPAGLDVQEQLEAALRRSTGRRSAWPDAFDPASEAVRVVILDGFDALLPVGPGRPDTAERWSCLTDVERFQRGETEAGRPTAVIVTSRTVVADQVLTPASSTALRLEPSGRPCSASSPEEAIPFA